MAAEDANVQAGQAIPPMRRKKQQLSSQEALAILRAGEYGVLATAGLTGERGGALPYAVPISYALVEEGAKPTIALHCAVEGAKLEALRANPRACFVVVGSSSVAPRKLTAIYQSVMAFGRVREAATDEEKRAGLLALGAKYCPGLDELVAEEVDRHWGRTCVLLMEVDALSGKEAIELTRERS